MKIELKELENLLGLRGQNFSYTIQPLLRTGENYGSTMLAVDVKIYEDGGIIEQHYVAKMCPPSNLLQALFNTAVTYRNELGLYTDILPLLQSFQREHGVDDVMDFFSKLKAFRISLDPNSDKVDNDAVMLFNNLKFEGYELIDRLKGFSLECAELLIKDLAVFHAVPVAFKLQNPDEFKEKIYPFLKTHFEFCLPDDVKIRILNDTLQTAEEDEECSKLTKNIEETFINGNKNYSNRPSPREPFATIIHNDYWVNNSLIKFEDNGKPIKNVMVDFQVIEYGSPAEDLIFFLYSSITPKILSAKYDHLIDLYYTTFIDTLQKFKCDIKPFTFELFLKELDCSAKSLQFFHLLMMLPAIFTVKGTVKELGELDSDELLEMTAKTSDEYPEKIWFTVKDFAKRGWLEGLE